MLLPADICPAGGTALGPRCDSPLRKCPGGRPSRIGSSIVSMNPREKRVRRVAEKRGLVLRKCKLRDPEATGYGKYQLLDHGTVVFGPVGQLRPRIWRQLGRN